MARSKENQCFRKMIIPVEMMIIFPPKMIIYSQISNSVEQDPMGFGIWLSGKSVIRESICTLNFLALEKFSPR